MAKQTDDGDFEQAAERIRALNEQILDAVHTAGRSTLEAYEKMLRQIADQQASDTPGGEWFGKALRAQADMTQQFAKTMDELRTPKP